MLIRCGKSAIQARASAFNSRVAWANHAVESRSQVLPTGKPQPQSAKPAAMLCSQLPITTWRTEPRTNATVAAGSATTSPVQIMRSAGISSRAASPRTARVASRLLYGPPNTIRGPSTRSKGIGLGMMPSRLSDQGGRSSRNLTWRAEVRLAIVLASAPSLDEIIERQLTGSPGQQEHQDRSPEQVFGPCLWINERLDHRDHPEQRQCGNARR